MVYFTTNTYQMKREILNFSNKISKPLSKPDKKFTADMTYGMLAAGSCLLTDVVDQLHEDSKKINIVDRLSRHLDKGVPAQAASSYLQLKRVINPPIPLLLKLWNEVRLFLKKQLSAWIVVMMTIRCS